MPVFRAGAGEQSVLICDYEGNPWWPSPKFPDNQQEGGPVVVPAQQTIVLPLKLTLGQMSDGPHWLQVYFLDDPLARLATFPVTLRGK